jgi:hypothetical protein
MQPPEAVNQARHFFLPAANDRRKLTELPQRRHHVRFRFARRQTVAAVTLVEPIQSKELDLPPRPITHCRLALEQKKSLFSEPPNWIRYFFAAGPP